jgi:hypothetical protein
VDAVTGEWPEPWAIRVAEHERRRNNFDKLCARRRDQRVRPLRGGAVQQRGPQAG